ncbi:hypothetical protein [Vibrio alginolyticus]|uniref:hypothetical protein n=1 Tax=Vibrio alginolyticus TaxID=663 RepID=UPI003751EEA7
MTESNVSPLGGSDDVDSDFEKQSIDTSEKVDKKSFRIKRPKNWKDKSYRQLKDEVRKQFIEQGHDDVTEEVIETIVDDITRDVVKREKRQKIFSLLRISLLLSLITSLVTVALLLSSTNDKFVGKTEIQVAMKNAVLKNVPLDDLKIVFAKTAVPISDSFWPIVKPHLYYEKASLTLVDVLNDLKTEIYIKDGAMSKESTQLISTINALVFEYNKVNPFDGLDEQDIRDFRGIADKLESPKYNLIQTELASLTSSMKVKNNLIHQYLSSSNTSLYISIAAFVFSVMVSIWQLLTSRRSSQKQLIYEAIKEHQQHASE